MAMTESDSISPFTECEADADALADPDAPDIAGAGRQVRCDVRDRSGFRGTIDVLDDETGPRWRLGSDVELERSRRGDELGVDGAPSGGKLERHPPLALHMGVTGDDSEAKTNQRRIEEGMCCDRAVEAETPVDEAEDDAHEGVVDERRRPPVPDREGNGAGEDRAHASAATQRIHHQALGTGLPTSGAAITVRIEQHADMHQARSYMIATMFWSELIRPLMTEMSATISTAPSKTDQRSRDDRPRVITPLGESRRDAAVPDLSANDEGHDDVDDRRQDAADEQPRAERRLIDREEKDRAEDDETTHRDRDDRCPEHTLACRSRCVRLGRSEQDVLRCRGRLRNRFTDWRPRSGMRDRPDPPERAQILGDRKEVDEERKEAPPPLEQRSAQILLRDLLTVLAAEEAPMRDERISTMSPCWRRTLIVTAGARPHTEHTDAVSWNGSA